MTATRRTPLELKRFGPAEGESVLFTGPPNSIASLATRAQRRRDWSETNGSRECYGSFVAPAIAALAPGPLASWPLLTTFTTRDCTSAWPICLWSVLARPNTPVVCNWRCVHLMQTGEVAHAPYCKCVCFAIQLNTVYSYIYV